MKHATAPTSSISHRSPADWSMSRAGWPDNRYRAPVGYTVPAPVWRGPAAAAHPGVKVAAVVSRAGRFDLGRIAARGARSDLLIVGGRDQMVLKLNRQAQAAIPAGCEVAVVPGATHLFQEPGTLEQVAVLARDWFIDHLAHPGH